MGISKHLAERAETLAVEQANEDLSRNVKAVETMIIENLGNFEAKVWIDMIQWALSNYQVPDRIIDEYVQMISDTYCDGDFIDEDAGKYE